MRLLASSFAILLVLGAAALAQAPQPGQLPPPPQPSTTPQRMPARPLRPGEAPPKGAAVIKGYVMAVGTGTPVRRAQVRAASTEGGGGVTTTDAEGRFEIRELPAGRYNVMVNKAGYAMAYFGQRRPNEPGTPIDLADGQTAEKVNIQLARGAVIMGRIVDDNGEPIAGTQVAAMRQQLVGGTRRMMPGGGEGSTDRTDDQGGFRLYGLPPGDYFVSATNRNNMFGPNINNQEADGFAPTYYPGTPNVGEAARLTLKGGQEMTANFSLVVARMARVSGRALTSRGEPIARNMLTMSPADPSGGMGFMSMHNAMAGADGTFQFTNIPPGRYNLNVRPMNGMLNGTEEFAVMAITVGNDDLDNVIVTTSLGATARGVVVTDDGSAPPFRPDQVQIFAQPMDMGINMMGMGPTKVNADYSFEMNGLFDRRLLRASIGSGVSMGWYLKAVLFDGEDVTDRGVEFALGRAYEGLQVVVTRKATDLSGLVTDDRGKPILDATVIVFPTSREQWSYMTRYVRSTRPDTNGRYSFKAMPPHDDYLIIAVQNLESGQANDPEFLARAREEAKPLSLNEGETKAVDIKLSKLAP
jgi:hypothetical protein